MDSETAGLTRAFRDLEGPILELGLMASLACSQAEDYAQIHYRKDDEEAEVLLFAVHHLLKMIMEMRRDYFAIASGPTASEDATP